MIYVLFGEDDFSRHLSLEEIKKTIGDETVLAPNMTILEGQQVPMDQIRGACETMPFLATRRLVIIEGLLERFESKGKYARRKARFADAEDGYQTLAAYFHRVPDFTILVLLDGKINAQNPLLKELSKSQAIVKSFPLLRNVPLHQWTERRVVAQGGSISSSAVDLLAKFVGSNLWTMSSEIDKLVLFATGRRIEEDDVRLVVSYAQEANVFTMVDAILESRAGIAQELLQQLLHQGASPAYLLVMLSRQARILVLAKELGRQGLPIVEIQSKLGLAADFMVRRALEQAGKYSLGRLAEVYHRLLEADVAIKTGRYDAELALNILVAELCQGAVERNGLAGRPHLIDTHHVLT